MTIPWSRREFLRRGACLAATAAVPGCAAPATGGSLAEGNATLARARAAGVLSIGIANEAPYGFTDAAGNVTGEAVEVARTVLARIGVPAIRAVTVDFGELISGLTLAHQFDMISAGQFITPERCEAVAFSVPDYTAPTGFLVARGNPQGVRTFDDIRDRGLRLAVLGGAVELRFALDSGVPAAQVLELPDQQALLQAVDTRQVDAAALTTISLRSAVAGAPGAAVEVTPGFFPVINGQPVVPAGAFGFRPGDDDLREAVDTELRAMHESGEWLRIAEPFGFGPDNVPGPELTTESLCLGA